MQNTNPTSGVWNPESAIKPVRLSTGTTRAGTDVAIFTPVSLGAAPYDVLATGDVLFWTPLMDWTGYSCVTHLLSLQSRTGIGAQTLEIVCHSASPVPIMGNLSTDMRQVSDEGTGALGIAGLALNYISNRKTFPSLVATVGYYPLMFGHFSFGIVGGLVGVTDLKLWYTCFLSNPGFRS